MLKSEHLRLALLLTVLLMIAVYVPAPVQARSTTEALEFFLQEQRQAQRIPGLAFALVQDGEVLFTGAYGVDGYGNPLTTETPFMLGSLSKSFTALAVMTLVEEQRLELDAPVQQYLPEFTLADQAAAATITVRHLLNQVSGLSDSSAPAAATADPTDLQQAVASLHTATTATAVGTEFAYFNHNYVLLGRLIEVVSGQAYADYLRDAVLTPLALRNTTVSATSADWPQTAPNLLPGHVTLFVFPLALPEPLPYGAPAGGIISTAQDMARYLAFYTDPTPALVTPETIALMLTRRADLDSMYAMGWYEVDPQAVPRVIEHSGDVSTYHADMVFLPETNTAFVLLYNRNHLFSTLTSFPELRQGVVSTLTGNDARPGMLNTTNVGSVLGIIVVLSVLKDLSGILSARRWALNQRPKPGVRLLAPSLDLVVPLVLLLLLPTLIGWLTGRLITFATAFYLAPDLVGWLIIATILAVGRSLVRMVAMVQVSRTSVKREA